MIKTSKVSGYRSKLGLKVKSYKRTREYSHKEVCLAGHKFHKKNTYIRPDGGRDCKPCRAMRSALARKVRVLMEIAERIR